MTLERIHSQICHISSMSANTITHGSAFRSHVTFPSEILVIPARYRSGRIEMLRLGSQYGPKPCVCRRLARIRTKSVGLGEQVGGRGVERLKGD